MAEAAPSFEAGKGVVTACRGNMRVLQHIRMGVVVPMKRETKLRRTWESNRSNMPVVKGHHARQSGRRGRGGGDGGTNNGAS